MQFSLRKGEIVISILHNNRHRKRYSIIRGGMTSPWNIHLENNFSLYALKSPVQKIVTMILKYFWMDLSNNIIYQFSLAHYLLKCYHCNCVKIQVWRLRVRRWGLNRRPGMKAVKGEFDWRLFSVEMVFLRWLLSASQSPLSERWRLTDTVWSGRPSQLLDALRGSQSPPTLPGAHLTITSPHWYNITPGAQQFTRQTQWAIWLGAVTRWRCEEMNMRMRAVSSGSRSLWGGQIVLSRNVSSLVSYQASWRRLKRSNKTNLSRRGNLKI